MIEPQQFKIHVLDETLGDIRRRVADFPWHEMPDDGGRACGAKLDYMKELCDYWANHYDWRAQKAALNEFFLLKAPVGDIDIHFIHEKGSGPNPIPLSISISHGWPGSVAEFEDVIKPMTHPEKFGGDPALSFDVVAPSLPGFSNSGRRPVRGDRVGLRAHSITG
jgi:hypothetical protein